MGINFSNFVRQLLGKKQVKIVMVGHPHAGKTTILYNLKLGEVVTTIPTIGFNVESLEYNNIRFVVWDVGGGDKFRPLWRHYLRDSQGVVFVVDCEDREVITEVWDDLKMMLQEDALKDVAILVIANKQDLAHSMSVSELEDKLDLSRNLPGMRWRIQAASATQGYGLREGFDWLADELAKK
ncbi:ADP-ribosylation factor 4-like isoform X4 [Daphnia pulex]|uniref:ADP-ribosylation factor 4-like isoform X4 n=1 Tax=Daphnia pulex TaxID=6669 RepID=UPI001EDCD275|nr:ADP-ribosylation factor 4-like isoform X4 [Daphnia pulex]